MLAIVNCLGGLLGRTGDRVRRGAAAEERARFKDVNLKAGAAQGGGSSQAREASTGDENFRH